MGGRKKRRKDDRAKRRKGRRKDTHGEKTRGTRCAYLRRPSHGYHPLNGEIEIGRYSDKEREREENSGMAFCSFKTGHRPGLTLR